MPRMVFSTLVTSGPLSSYSSATLRPVKSIFTGPWSVGPSSTTRSQPLRRESDTVPRRSASSSSHSGTESRTEPASRFPVQRPSTVYSSVPHIRSWARPFL
ncbi:MAG: hypothetical protein IPL76_01365 [Gemmatimonadetes bacterium]|nr:hypothetical protein [Gemmatimonadota bacterium]